MTEWRILACFGVLLFSDWAIRRWLPPERRYLSRRKRRAMRIALEEFAAEHPGLRPNGERSRIFRSDGEKCLVYVAHTTCLIPADHSIYVVWDDHDTPQRLGNWNFRWEKLSQCDMQRP